MNVFLRELTRSSRIDQKYPMVRRVCLLVSYAFLIYFCYGITFGAKAHADQIYYGYADSECANVSMTGTITELFEEEMVGYKEISNVPTWLQQCRMVPDTATVTINGFNPCACYNLCCRGV